MDRDSSERKVLHKLVWGKIANTGREKSDVLDDIGIPEEEMPVNYCFACEEAGMDPDGTEDIKVKCERCPIIWGTENSEVKTESQTAFCEREGSPYNMFLDSEDKIGRQDAAKKLLKLEYKGTWDNNRKKKVKIRVPHKIVIEDINWSENDYCVYPFGNFPTEYPEMNEWEDLVGKPVMKMTLEWEE